MHAQLSDALSMAVHLTACCWRRNHLQEWLKLGTATEMRPFVRDLNAYTSQEVFAGQPAAVLEAGSSELQAEAVGRAARSLGTQPSSSQSAMCEGHR